jgi:hypothetical protein
MLRARFFGVDRVYDFLDAETNALTRIGMDLVEGRCRASSKALSPA